MASPVRCYYEILGVERDCDVNDLKKAYKKLALKWHPDKNQEDSAACTKEFLLIQKAYEVLCDPNERAWYDQHRQQILRGGFDPANAAAYQDDSLDIFPFMHASCFTGYDDSEGGFYWVYRDVFEQIAAEDAEFQETEQFVPGFGRSDSDYEQVVRPFYAFWEGYCTAKSYVWVEKFDTREAPNRPTKRAMEAENRKLRDTARKQRNKDVRMLVSFVRKRDGRVKDYKAKLELRAKENAERNKEAQARQKWENFQNLHAQPTDGRKDELDAVEKMLADIEANMAEIFPCSSSESDQDECDDPDASGELAEAAEAAEASAGDAACAACAACALDDATLDDLDDDASAPLPDEGADPLYCIACSKGFRNASSFRNHENSTKHRQNLRRLVADMSEEDRLLFGVAEETSGQAASKAAASEGAAETGGTQSRSKKAKKKRRAQQTASRACEPDAPDSSDDALSPDSAASPDDPESPSALPAPLAAAPEMQPKDDRCSVCGQTFSSRNLLFAHIRQSGHAALKPAPSAPDKTAASKKDRSAKKDKSQIKKGK